MSRFLFRYNEQLTIKDYLDTLVALKSVGDVIQECMVIIYRVGIAVTDTKMIEEFGERDTREA